MTYRTRDGAWLTREAIITCAVEDVESGAHPGPEPRTLAQALLILQETGSLSLCVAN